MFDIFLPIFSCKNNQAPVAVQQEVCSRDFQQSMILKMAAEAQRNFALSMNDMQVNAMNQHNSFMSNLVKMHENLQKD